MEGHFPAGAVWSPVSSAIHCKLATSAPRDLSATRPQRQLNHLARSEHPINSRPNDALFLYRRVKLSHLSLLFCADCIALLSGIKQLAECERLDSNLLYKFFSYSNIATRRDFLPERSPLQALAGETFLWRPHWVNHENNRRNSNRSPNQICIAI